VRTTYSTLTQSVFILDRVNSSSYDCSEKMSVDLMPSGLRLLILVASHPKLQRFFQLCAKFMLLLEPKPPLAHYSAFIF
jgi:hypothetical protein